jgi:hypothetical protein
VGTRGRLIAVAALLVLVVLVGFAVRAVSLSVAQGEYDAAAAAFQADQSTAVQTVTDGESALDEAIAVLAASEGKVLTEQPRTDLAAAIEAATGRLSTAAQELTAAERVADASLVSSTSAPASATAPKRSPRWSSRPRPAWTASPPT